MSSASARFASIVLLAFVAAATGCGDPAETPSFETTPPADSTSLAGFSSPSPSGAPAARGTLSASPNPIQVCDGSGLGVTRLSWSASPGIAVQVRVGRPDGALFASTGNVGEKDTGKWVNDGAKFYLVRAAGPGAPPSVLGSTEVRVTKEGCN